MAQIFKGVVFSKSPYPSAEVNYEYVRDGANMKYHFWGRVYLEHSTGWYHNNLQVKLYLNGSNVIGELTRERVYSQMGEFDQGTKIGRLRTVVLDNNNIIEYI